MLGFGALCAQGICAETECFSNKRPKRCKQTRPENSQRLLKRGKAGVSPSPLGSLLGQAVHLLIAQSQGTEKHLRHFTLLGWVAENSHKMKNKPVGQLTQTVMLKQTLSSKLEAGCRTKTELSSDLRSRCMELQSGVRRQCHLSLQKGHLT